MIVAIDGPAGAGKSSVALRLSERLGLTLVDTGAIYRSVAHEAKLRGIPVSDELGLAALLPALAASLTFVQAQGKTRVQLGGADITEEIRTPAMSQNASALSAWPKVRLGPSKSCSASSRPQRAAAGGGARGPRHRHGGLPRTPRPRILPHRLGPGARRAPPPRARRAQASRSTLAEVLRDRGEARSRRLSTRAVAPLKRRPPTPR